ncbi:hypothetical protein WJX81_005300 [Elliptochloris bilobata]|uniref:glutamate decarboxylase n=1 Tax=Elliptochloris bilobata TaxID=381761 RepID=A0AAW1RG42_9CHLO
MVTTTDASTGTASKHDTTILAAMVKEAGADLDDRIMPLNQERGWDIKIHVDAASGAFIAPFQYPSLPWDFRLPKVGSINASGHKYGLVYPGLGWLVFRSREYLPESLVFHENYLGARPRPAASFPDMKI